MFIQKLAHAAGIDVGGVDDRDDLLGYGIERLQHVETLPAARRFDPNPSHTPQHRHERTQDKLDRVDKEHGSHIRVGLSQARVEPVSSRIAAMAALMEAGGWPRK